MTRPKSLTQYLPHLKWAVPFITGGLLVFGFGLQTPKSRFNDLEAEVREVREQVEEDHKHHEYDDKLLRAVIIGECIDRDRNELRRMQIAAVCDTLAPR